MAIKNPWVGYKVRSFEDIKKSIIDRLKILTPEIKDYSETNLLIVIVSILAGLLEQFHYYLDAWYREIFITTARRYSSVVKLSHFLDYRIKSAIPSTVDLTFYFKDTNGDPVAITTGMGLAAGLVCSTESGIPFVTLEPVILEPGDTGFTVKASQISSETDVNLGTTTGEALQTIALGNNYAHDSLVLKVDGTIWDLKDTLGRSKATDTHYTVNISEEQIAMIIFGDNINGAIPPAGKSVTGNLNVTYGRDGNVDANTITQITTALTIAGVDTIEVNNPLASSGGDNIEDISRVRRSVPLSIRTLDRAVTAQDYRDIALLAPGVQNVAILYTCGKPVYIYITPIGGGIAQQALLDSTRDFMDKRRMIVPPIELYAAGEGYIFLKINVTLKFRRDPIIANTNIITALTTEYNYANSYLNRPVRLSDIISLIDNIEEVDFVEVEKLYLKSYPRPTLSSTINLDWNLEILNKSITNIPWTIIYLGSNLFRVLKNNAHAGYIPVGVQYYDSAGILTFKINAGAYTVGDSWSFISYPYNASMVIEDYSVPIINVNNIQCTITQTTKLV